MKIRITTSALAAAALWTYHSSVFAQGFGVPECRGGYSNDLPNNANAFQPIDTMSVILTVATFLALHFMPAPAKRELHLLKDCLQLLALIVVPIAAQQLLSSLFGGL
ncbi:MAG: hypothetical protein HYX67_14845 [Candidatus Melainabacteria bacterium]|nr:hypothetical protein [Candidatus Melainabacteria bacterium]